ncbi:MAG: DUF1223 domain-containing protein [Proteobacteria bacterium]|nr:DUF1223 domain-containing protein [Pseudomonadota bacterium]
MLSRRAFSLAALGTLAATARAPGQSGSDAPRTPGVVELFTSQGCSSCPPADALMLELAKAPDVIPLTYPVEIWDYLGWKDTLAKPAFTARQKAYASMVADRRVFTPQAVVNGKASCVGSDTSAIRKLRERGANGSGARLAVATTPEGWQITPQLITGSMARLFVLPLILRKDVRIDRGENRGRIISYAHVVRDIRDAGALENGKPVALTRSDVTAPEADAFALLAQLGTLESPGLILAAALVDGSAVKA